LDSSWAVGRRVVIAGAAEPKRGDEAPCSTCDDASSSRCLAARRSRGRWRHARSSALHHPAVSASCGLSPESKEVKQFRLGLRDAGYSEGRDVVIEWRSASGDYDRVPALVADLVQKKVEVIVQDSTIGTEVTKRATSTIPIVMALVLDPVGSGLVKSLAHPGENVTGLSMMATARSSLLASPITSCRTRTIQSSSGAANCRAGERTATSRERKGSSIAATTTRSARMVGHSIRGIRSTAFPSGKSRPGVTGFRNAS
jgi:ABC transporter substrate binding protein